MDRAWLEQQISELEANIARSRDQYQAMNGALAFARQALAKMAMPVPASETAAADTQGNLSHFPAAV